MFDTQIHLGDVILAAITLVFLPFIKSSYGVMTSLRDSVRDLTRAVGQENPPTGLHLRVSNLEELTERRRYPRD